MVLKKKRFYSGFCIICIITLGLLFYFIFVFSEAKIGNLGSAHKHADFKVYTKGKAINFSLPQYQLRSKYVHLENSDGDLIHTHATGITLGFFFKTLGIKFNNKCFIIDKGEKFCNKNDKTLKLYVDGQVSYEFEKYMIQNSDKILISYGNETDEKVKEQLASITNKAIKK